MGIALPGAVCLAILFMDTRVHGRKDIEGVTSVPYLGEIPLDKSLKFPMESKNIFTVKVMYRQHYTWQGQIVWIGQDKVRFFRSDLELIALIYSTYNEDYQ